MYDDLLDHAKTFAGMPVKEFHPFNPGEPVDPSCAYRISLIYDTDPERHKSGCLVSLWREFTGGNRFKQHKISSAELLNRLLAQPGSEGIRALVAAFGDDDIVGVSASTESFLDALAGQQKRLPNLTALFTGDLIQEECEISWINQCSYEALLREHPKLEILKIRGANDLSFGDKLKHGALKSLTIQSGGLSKSVVAQIAAAELPQLEHLELWFGDEQYGGDGTIADVKPLLGGRFPMLKYLGLKNAMFTDDIAREISVTRMPEGLETLDLSLGTAGDEGAEFLLQAPGIRKLKRLVVEHHFLSKQAEEKLKRLPIKVELSAEKPVEDDELKRYVAVSE